MLLHHLAFGREVKMLPGGTELQKKIPAEAPDCQDYGHPAGKNWGCVDQKVKMTQVKKHIYTVKSHRASGQTSGVACKPICETETLQGLDLTEKLC